MSIREDVRNLKTSKNLIRTSIANKGEIIPENTKLELYPYYIDKLKIKEEDDGDGQLNEQLPNPVTGISTEYVDDTTLRVSWTAPSDNVAGYAIAWKENGIPTFPLDTDQVVQTVGTETDVTITGLTTGNTYGFLVMPKNANGLRQTCVNSENSTLIEFSNQA